MKKSNTLRILYYLYKRFADGTILFFKSLFKPLSFMKGEDFEKCLRKKVFKKAEYDLIMQTNDFHKNKSDYVESSLYPDYLLRDRSINEEFWVEAKYREKLYMGKIEWCIPYQFKRYKKLSKQMNVVIAIGFGGRPINPEKIYLIPLNEIQYTGLYPKSIAEYEFDGKWWKISSQILQDHCKVTGIRLIKI